MKRLFTLLSICVSLHWSSSIMSFDVKKTSTYFQAFFVQRLLDSNSPRFIQNALAYSDLYNAVHNRNYEIHAESSLKVLRKAGFLGKDETKIDQDKAEHLKKLFNKGKL